MVFVPYPSPGQTRSPLDGTGPSSGETTSSPPGGTRSPGITEQGYLILNKGLGTYAIFPTEIRYPDIVRPLFGLLGVMPYFLMDIVSVAVIGWAER
jgi:hypothetical protein